MTPPGSLFFMYIITLFNTYRYRYESRWFLQVDALAGTRSWDLGEVLGFFLISLPVADLVPFYNTIPVGWIVDTHLQGSFSADPCMLANPVRSHAFN